MPRNAVQYRDKLLFGQQHTVDSASHKSPHKHRRLHLSCFDSMRIYFLSRCVKKMELWDLLFFHGNNKINSACKTLTNLRVAFMSSLK